LEVEKQCKARHAGPAFATFVGTWETRDRLEVFQRSDGSTVANGFGALGLYPAQLLVTTVKDVEVQAQE
jgi:hypothetical protein